MSHEIVVPKLLIPENSRLDLAIPLPRRLVENWQAYPVLRDLAREIWDIDPNTCVHQAAVAMCFDGLLDVLPPIIDVVSTDKHVPWSVFGNHITGIYFHDLGRIGTTPCFRETVAIMNHAPPAKLDDRPQITDVRRRDEIVLHDLHDLIGYWMLLRLPKYYRDPAIPWSYWADLALHHYGRFANVEEIYSNSDWSRNNRRYFGHLLTLLEVADTVASMSLARVFRPQPPGEAKMRNVLMQILSRERLTDTFQIPFHMTELVQSHMIDVVCQQADKLARLYPPHLCLYPEEFTFFGVPYDPVGKDGRYDYVLQKVLDDIWRDPRFRILVETAVKNGRTV